MEKVYLSENNCINQDFEDLEKLNRIVGFRCGFDIEGLKKDVEWQKKRIYDISGKIYAFDKSNAQSSVSDIKKDLEEKNTQIEDLSARLKKLETKLAERFDDDHNSPVIDHTIAPSDSTSDHTSEPHVDQTTTHSESSSDHISDPEQAKTHSEPSSDPSTASSEEQNEPALIK